jgi:hypothetical protein
LPRLEIAVFEDRRGIREKHRERTVAATGTRTSVTTLAAPAATTTAVATTIDPIGNFLTGTAPATPTTGSMSTGPPIS